MIPNLSRWLALAPVALLLACSGVPLDDLKTSEFRVVRTSQKPIWAYSKCLAEHFASLRGGGVANDPLRLTVNVTDTGIELMSRDKSRERDPVNYWYFVEVRPIEDGVRTSAWVCRCFNRPTPQQMLVRIDDAIQICGSESV